MTVVVVLHEQGYTSLPSGRELMKVLCCQEQACVQKDGGEPYRIYRNAAGR